MNELMHRRRSLGIAGRAGRAVAIALALLVAGAVEASEEPGGDGQAELRARTAVLEPGQKLQPKHLTHRVRYYRRDLEEDRKDAPLRVEIRVGVQDGGGGKVEYVASIVSLDEKGRPHGGKLHYASARWNERTHLTPYVHGVKHGTEVEYTGWGGGGGSWKVAENPWVEGEMTGIRKTFDKAGNIVSNTPYKKGKAAGTSRTFNAEGELLSETPFVDGRKHGRKVDYWPRSGEPRRVIPYKNGRAHGTMKAYHLNGKLKRRVTCRDGLLHGEEVLFSDEGKLITRRFWLAGEMVSRSRFELAQRASAGENEG